MSGLEIGLEVLLWCVLTLTIIVFVKAVVFGKFLWDRLLGMSLIYTKMIVAIIFFASINETAFLLDFAIIYAMFGFIGTIFIATFLSKRGRKRNE